MMEQTKQAIRFTYEDYAHFPDDRKQYQIVDGEVYMVPAPVPYHQIVLGVNKVFESKVIKEFSIRVEEAFKG